MKKTILITSVGSPGFDCIFSSIEEWSQQTGIQLKVIGVDADENALGKHFVDVWYKVPRADHDYASLIQQINEIVEKHNVDLIIPIGDVELGVIEDLGLQDKSSSAPEKTRIKDVQDKLRLYELLASSASDEIKRALPRFKIASQYNEIENFVSNELAISHALCAKPRYTSGARGVLKIIDEDDLNLEKIKNSKMSLIEANSKRFLKAAQNYLEKGNTFDYALCEYLPGDEYSVDLYRSRSNFKIAVSRRRKKITSGICTEAVIEDPDQLKNIALDIADHLRLFGNINMQFKKSQEGSFKLLEINPRLSGTVAACRAAGVDFVKVMLSDRLIGEIHNSVVMRETINLAEKNQNVMKRTYKEYFLIKDKIMK